jgi:hypothetical protein
MNQDPGNGTVINYPPCFGTAHSGVVLRPAANHLWGLVPSGVTRLAGTLFMLTKT